MGDIKATSFRINEDDIAKFKEFAEQEGYNQAEAFKSMVQTLEMARAKGMIKDRAKEIEVFQDTINSLMGMFINSLNINQLSEESIREELSLELNNKDNTISMAFEQIEELKADNKKLNDTIKEIEEINKYFDEKIMLLDDDVKDKQKNIDKLNSNNDLLQEQLQEYKQYKTNYSSLLEEVEQVKAEQQALRDINGKLINDNELLNSKLQANTDIINFYKDEIETKNTSINEFKDDIKALESKNNKQLEELAAVHTKALNDSIDNLKDKHEVELSRKDLEIQTLKREIEELKKLQEVKNKKEK